MKLGLSHSSSGYNTRRIHGSDGGGGSIAPSYLNWNGVGDRRFSTGMINTNTVSFTGGNPLIDGNTTGGNFWNGTTGYMRFQFESPRLITEAKWYQSGTQTHGVWKWQGSLDGSNWTDIGNTFTLGGATIQTHTQLNGNNVKYTYYQLIWVSGSLSTGPSIYELEFQIDADTSEASWEYGSGDRRASIALTNSSGWSGTVNTLLDGVKTTSALSFSGAPTTGLWVTFDYGVGNAKIVKAVSWIKNATAGTDTWKLRASDDNSTWTDLTASLGPAANTMLFDCSGNTTAYRYYQLFQTGGNVSSSTYSWEVVFKLAKP